MSDIWVHQLSPFLIEFSEGVGIRWYGLAYIMGFVAAYLSVYWMAKNGRTYLKPIDVSDFIVYMALGTMIGGRIGYVLFYSPDLLGFYDKFPYWKLLAVHEGGMASHGGMIGIVTAAVWFATDFEKSAPGWRMAKWLLGLPLLVGGAWKGLCHLFGKKDAVASLQFRFPMMHIVDIACLGGPLGVFFGRIANFINGELYGREAPADFKWAVKFPSEIFRWYSESIEKLKQLGPAVQALGPIPTGRGSETISADVSLWNQWMLDVAGPSRKYIEHFIDAIVHATQKGNQAVIEALGPVLTPRYPSQLYQAFLEGLFVFIILALIWLKPRKIGVISGVFGILYPVARIIGEHYRLPDAQIGFEALGLTRGQWLSIGMLILMSFYLLRAIKSDSPKVGGLLEPKK